MNNKEHIIVVLSGKARSGKNTIETIIKNKLEDLGIKTASMMIAKPIKDYAKEYFNWDGSEETKPRDFLQSIGSHIRFDLNMPNFLIQRCCEDAKIISEYKKVIFITDCRFRQELAFFKAYFPDNLITIRMERPNYESPLTKEQQNHITETDLDNVRDWDYIIEAKSIEEIINKVDKIGIVDNILNTINFTK